jgi:hypothetical protein
MRGPRDRPAARFELFCALWQWAQYAVRPDKAWLIDDLESYKENALWVLDFETAR